MRSPRVRLLRLYLSVCLAVLWCMPLRVQAHGDGPLLRLGVFAYLGMQETTAEYEPLVRYLNSVQHHRVELRVLPLDELTRQ